MSCGPKFHSAVHKKIQVHVVVRSVVLKLEKIRELFFDAMFVYGVILMRAADSKLFSTWKKANKNRTLEGKKKNSLQTHCVTMAFIIDAWYL